ncbi:MAG TPA: CDP-glycerol glycerophosphotransferase family protein [Candidatus Nanoarchaeia archaeon]|nr:CDP-glycerol glycerophosphotransferase family protein [Candidatus Nanoarchaeia archaeon]
MKRIIILDWEKRNLPSSNKLLRSGYSFIESVYLFLTRNFFILPQIRRLLKAGDTKIFAVDKETEVWLAENDISFLPLDHYMTEEEYLRWGNDSVLFIRGVPQLVPEIDFMVDGVSFWLAEELSISEAFLFPAIHCVENIRRIITEEKAEEIILLDHSSRSGMLQKQLGKEVTVTDKTNPVSRIKKIIFEVYMPFAMKLVGGNVPQENRASPKKTKEVLFLEGKRGVLYSQGFLERIREQVTIFHEEPIADRRFEQILPEEYFESASRNRVLQVKKYLEERLKRFKQNMAWQKKFSYRGVSLFPAFGDLIEYLFRVAYVKIAVYQECVGNLLEKNRPRLIVILGECHRHHHIALSAGKKGGIPSLFVMHGSFGNYSLYRDLLSDKIALYGRSYAKILCGLGNKGRGRMIITGNPAWDYLKGKKWDREKLYNQLGLPKDKKIILLAATNMPDERDRLAHATIKAMAQLPQYRLILKLHPEEELGYYKQLLKEYNVKATIVMELSLLHPLISISEVVITAYSTVGLESLLLGKPVIDVNLTNRPYYQDYVAEGVALGIRKEEELVKAIQSLAEDTQVRKLLGKNRKKYLYEHAYKQDGRAGERVVKLIEKMIKR